MHLYYFYLLYYQNQRSVHAFNVVELDGKLRGVDVTWDCTKNPGEKCSFRNFGRDPKFYEKYGHQIAGDSQEIVFDLIIQGMNLTGMKFRYFITNRNRAKARKY